MTIQSQTVFPNPHYTLERQSHEDRPVFLLHAPHHLFLHSPFHILAFQHYAIPSYHTIDLAGGLLNVEWVVTKAVSVAVFDSELFRGRTVVAIGIGNPKVARASVEYHFELLLRVADLNVGVELWTLEWF